MTVSNVELTSPKFDLELKPIKFVGTCIVYLLFSCLNCTASQSYITVLCHCQYVHLCYYDSQLLHCVVHVSISYLISMFSFIQKSVPPIPPLQQVNS